MPTSRPRESISGPPEWPGRICALTATQSAPLSDTINLAGKDIFVTRVMRRNFECDWPYAVRRYNGSGPNSYSYQALVLKKRLVQ